MAVGALVADSLTVSGRHACVERACVERACVQPHACGVMMVVGIRSGCLLVKAARRLMAGVQQAHMWYPMS